MLQNQQMQQDSLKKIFSQTKETEFNATHFCETYVDCWADATSGDVRYRNLSFPHLYIGKRCVDNIENRNKAGIKAWTDFHMEKILYPLITRLKYKTNPCDECASHNEENDYKCKKTRCGYGATWQREYYKVDLSLYTYGEKWMWRADYFIEHENETFILPAENQKEQQGWLGEFNKLCPLKCSKNGAKVIISYSDLDAVNISNIIKYLCTNLDNETTKESLTDSPILIILAPTVGYIKRAKKQDFDIIFTFILFEKKNGTWICTSNRANEMTDGNLVVKKGLDACQTKIIERFNKLKDCVKV